MEDQSGASYAGQYDTYLNVPCEYDAVAQAIRRCWASVWHERLLAYRKSQNIDPNLLPSMAVVIQRQLNPLASGVLFTMNPMNGNSAECVVESCWGLGEGVVCGEISPHTFVVNWKTSEFLKQEVPSQLKKFTFAEGGSSQHPEDYISLTDTTEGEKEICSLQSRADFVLGPNGTTSCKLLSAPSGY